VGCMWWTRKKYKLVWRRAGESLSGGRRRDDDDDDTNLGHAMTTAGGGVRGTETTTYGTYCVTRNNGRG